MLVSSAKLTELQAKVTQLEADLGKATEGQAALQTELTQAKADLQAATEKATTLETSLSEANTKLTEATGKITKLETDLAAANQKVTTAEASIQTQVTAHLAAAGVDPVKRDPSAKVGDDGKPKIDASAPPRQRAVSAMKGWKIFGKN